MSDELVLLLGTHGHHIHSARFDPKSLSLTYGTKTPFSENPSWLSRHPTQEGIIYSNGHANGKVFCVKHGPDGSVEVLDEADSGGGGPTHLAVLNDLSGLAIAHYNTGNVTVVPLDGQGRFLSSSISPPNNFIPPYTPHSHARQEGPHAHQIVVVDDQVLVPDLGSNTIWRLKWSEPNGWELVGDIKGFQEGDGPRHCVVHLSGKYIYVLNEITSVLTVHTLPTSGPSQLLNRLTLLPEEDEPHENLMGAAEIVLLPPLTPTSPTLLICSNRDSPNPQGDALALFSVSPDGSQVTRTEQEWVKGVGKHLRGLTVDKTGKWVCCAARNGGGVVIFERVGKDGLELKEVARLDLDTTVAPLWI
ncbi:Lactonase, 7-bladed beta-propeller-domain-containing protein [Naematelia encephala]|uniref:Lactonase, 7-bladed beta-propeller-domain-containing protein n=1 Tax=Naematelia encephala TaxID=71784 RepID=A0A1Y2ASQ0_9TREE|nr:Lactonase, 7-bladed beta-propeller-domain-containing protein [Naematelia encephala]